MASLPPFHMKLSKMSFSQTLLDTCRKNRDFCYHFFRFCSYIERGALKLYWPLSKFNYFDENVFPIHHLPSKLSIFEGSYLKISKCLTHCIKCKLTITSIMLHHSFCKNMTVLLFCLDEWNILWFFNFDLID